VIAHARTFAGEGRIVENGGKRGRSSSPLFLVLRPKGTLLSLHAAE
jgi:hypothetical protein